MPTYERCPVPGYTSAAKDVGVQGTVVFDAVIIAQGGIVALRSTRMLGLRLDETAYDAMMRTWRMKPATDKGGKPIFVQLPIEFTFAPY